MNSLSLNFSVLGLKGERVLMARKKISTTVYITEDQNELLKQLNKKTKVPIAEFIRQGIDLVLEKYKKELPGQMSLIDSSSAGSRRS